MNGNPCPHCTPLDFLAEVEAFYSRWAANHDVFEDGHLPRWREVKRRAEILVAELDGDLVRSTVEGE